MSKLSVVEPKDKPNVINLVEAAGVNVSDWANCNTAASRNPKYCYEWAFVEPKKVVVLNLWFHRMVETKNGIIMRDINLRKAASSLNEPGRTRALNFDAAIQTAVKDKLQVRVIVQVAKPPGTYETVAKRLLDPVAWTVTAYDWKTGDCILKRGVHKKTGPKNERENAIDDLTESPEGNHFPDRATAVVQVVRRDNRVREHVLERAKGRCEHCGGSRLSYSEWKILRGDSPRHRTFRLRPRHD